MTEISRDGKRVYFTNSLYSRWDTQFYPEGVPGRQVMCHVGKDGGIDARPEVRRRLRRRTTARTRSGCRAATARPIRSATRRPEAGGAGIAVSAATVSLWAGRGGDRRLPRAESRDGLAAGGGQRPGREARRGGVRHAGCRWAPATCWRWRWCSCRSRCSRGCCSGAARSASAPASLVRAVRRLAVAAAAPPSGWLARIRPTQLALWSLPDGDRARRGADAAADPHGAVRDAGRRAASAGRRLDHEADDGAHARRRRARR